MASVKKLSVIFVMLLVLISASSLSYAFQNEPNMFRGIKWGTDISELPQMTLVENSGSIKVYEIKDCTLSFEIFQLKCIMYVFIKGKLAGSIVKCDSRKNFENVRASIFAYHSEGTQIDPSNEYYVWLGDNVNISMKYNPVSEETVVYYYYNPLMNEREENDNGKISV